MEQPKTYVSNPAGIPGKAGLPVLEIFSCGHNRVRHDFGFSSYAAPEHMGDTEAWRRAALLSSDPALIAYPTYEERAQLGSLGKATEIFTNGPCSNPHCQERYQFRYGFADVVEQIVYDTEERGRAQAFNTAARKAISDLSNAIDRIAALNPLVLRTAEALQLEEIRNKFDVLELADDGSLHWNVSTASTGIDQLHFLTSRLSQAVASRAPRVTFDANSAHAVEVLRRVERKAWGLTRLADILERVELEFSQRGLLSDWEVYLTSPFYQGAVYDHFLEQSFDEMLLREEVAMAFFKEWVTPADGVAAPRLRIDTSVGEHGAPTPVEILPVFTVDLTSQAAVSSPLSGSWTGDSEMWAGEAEEPWTSSSSSFSTHERAVPSPLSSSWTGDFEMWDSEPEASWSSPSPSPSSDLQAPEGCRAVVLTTTAEPQPPLQDPYSPEYARMRADIYRSLGLDPASPTKYVFN